jgi:enoyl-CoA hydratase
MAFITFTTQNHIATLTVKRPEVRNALSWRAMEEFAEAIEQAHAQPDLLALIITGAGGSFISGGDITDLHQEYTETEGLRMITLMGDALQRLAALPCLTLAALDGPARGGGCEVALLCDWRVAAENASLGFVQVALGITTGWGGATRLMHTVGYARALELLTLGRVLTAAEAHRLGLITHLVAPGQALLTAQALAQSLPPFPEAVRAYKQILSAALRSPAQGDAVERAEFPKLWASAPHRAAVEKFLNGSQRS